MRPAGFELELRVRTGADHAGDHLLVAALLAQALRDDLDLPALALGVARIHAEQVAGEQAGFVAAGSRADLEEQVSFVVRIARQQRALQLGVDALHLGLRGLELIVGEHLHLGIRRHLTRGIGIALGVAKARVQPDQSGQLGVLAREVLELRQVARRILGGEDPVELLEPCRGDVQPAAQ
jgi:hypothetical protein